MSNCSVVRLCCTIRWASHQFENRIRGRIARAQWLSINAILFGWTKSIASRCSFILFRLQHYGNCFFFFQIVGIVQILMWFCRATYRQPAKRNTEMSPVGSTICRRTIPFDRTYQPWICRIHCSMDGPPERTFESPRQSMIVFVESNSECYAVLNCVATLHLN